MMPEDIPEPAVRLTEEEVGIRASEWSDFRRDYASPDEKVRAREYAAFCAGWDARHTSAYLTPAQQAAIDRVKHMIEANSHVTASITEALYTDATARADADALAGLSDRRRADVEAAREKIAEAPRHFAPYGASNALCDETVPPRVAWDERTGEYADGRFTVMQDRTTCPECRFRMGRGPVTGEPEGAEPLPAHDHRPIQHRDGREPWCRTCGLNADYNAPHSMFTSRREAREAALRERGQALATAAGAGQVSAADIARAAHIAAGGDPNDLLASGGGLRRPIRDEPQA
ncbi:hypothetical protein SEA_MEMENTOMORI_93 [Microbacterium phage MementoMori]|uniref:Uncharacterized protein n=1 Tax=Microbacterium phage MementoMori TaxID=2201436 RepID=A0A2Z4Q5J7_9CAUD|nr:hypothetical protein HOT41_gp16 [Microbacterium phage MementoMori]AWY05347.1 hypothetical protein SEA_MEMENTOMORI_93 [Microbacterium phage MementoMori]